MNYIVVARRKELLDEESADDAADLRRCRFDGVSLSISRVSLERVRVERVGVEDTPNLPWCK